MLLKICPWFPPIKSSSSNVFFFGLQYPLKRVSKNHKTTKHVDDRSSEFSPSPVEMANRKMADGCDPTVTCNKLHVPVVWFQAVGQLIGDGSSTAKKCVPSTVCQASSKEWLVTKKVFVLQKMVFPGRFTNKANKYKTLLSPNLKIYLYNQIHEH